MSRLLVAQRALTVPGWAKDALWRNARAVPSLDLRFADNKSLVDAVTGASLITFTRASSGTFVDSAGVLRTAVTNLNTNSEAFDTYSTSAGSVSANAGTAPNGTLTADEITSTGGGVYKSISGTTASTTFTVSVYAKYVLGSDLFSFGFDSNPSSGRANFNLQTGALGTADANVVSRSITPVGDGWYRCSVTAIVTSTSTIVVFYNGTSGAKWILWGAQLEQSATVGEYIPTTSAINSAPRFDHNPITGESLGLLVEEARANLLLQSNAFTTTWQAVANTLTSASAVSPDGTTNGWRFADTAANSTHNIFQTIAWTAVATTFTVYAKYDTHRWVGARIGNTGNQFFGSWDLQNGVVGSFTAGATIGMQAVGNGWYRLTLTATLTSAGSANVLLYLNNADSASALTYAGTSTGSYIYGAQLEAGAFPTSYIPTTTAAATRSADVVSIDGSAFTSFYNQSEGTVFAEGVNNNTSGTPQIARLLNTADLAYRLDLYRVASTLFRSGFFVSDATTQVNTSTLPDGSWPINLRIATCAAYKENNFAIVATGGAPATDTSGTVPTNIDQLKIGNQYTGTIRRLTFWPQALPGQLRAITQ